MGVYRLTSKKEISTGILLGGSVSGLFLGFGLLSQELVWAETGAGSGTAAKPSHASLSTTTLSAGSSSTTLKPGSPKSTEWAELLKSAWQLNLSGDNQEASLKAQAGLASAEKLKDDKGIISSLNAMADILDSQGNIPEQEDLRRRALDLAASSGGKSSPQYARELAKMASWYARKGEQGQARSMLDEAMAVLGNGGETKNPHEMSSCYLALARRQISEGTFGLADDSFSKALTLQDNSGSPEQAEALQIAKEYSALLDKLGRKSEADKLKDRINLARASSSLGNSSSGASTAGSGSKNLFLRLVQDARAASDAGDRSKCTSLWKLALQEAEKSANDRKMAFALVHLADESRYAKQNDEAESLYRKALSLREKTGATDDLGMARNLSRMSQCYIMNKKSSEAESLLRKAQEIEEKCQANPSSKAATLQSLISCSMTNKNNRQAEDAAKKMLAIADQLPGAAAAMNKRMAQSMLGSIYMQSGRMNEGMQLMKEVSASMSAVSPAETTKAYTVQWAEADKQADEAELKSFQ